MCGFSQFIFDCVCVHICNFIILDCVSGGTVGRKRSFFIALSDKEQLRVDYKNKPSSLARETLFTLYGRDTFRVLSVTGRGCKKGTYAIAKNVLESICGKLVNSRV
jgi:hypothetical protein